MSEDVARAEVAGRLASRGQSLVRLLRRTVYDQPQSPYLALLSRAGIELGDIEHLIEEEGVEGALGRLFDEGVYVAADEFKGRRPIERPGLSLEVAATDFDNPLLAKEFTLTTGGSSGASRPLMGNLELIADWARDTQLSWATHGLGGRHQAILYSPPPSIGLAAALGYAKTRHRIDRWFAPTPLDGRGRLLTGAAWLACRLWGAPFRWPEHTPPEDALRVARWIADVKRSGGDAEIACAPSSGVRICAAAAERGLDISGTVFWFGAEPYTAAKAEIVDASGCRGLSIYGMTEFGVIGISCAAPKERDDFHVSLDKLALLGRPRLVAGTELDVLFYTGLISTSPKLALNVECGDYGVLEERDCGCLLAELGLSLHLHTVRSHEKLTSEGQTFFGEDLVRIIEQVLPARFGGGPTDYQLVEEERDGLTKIRLIVAPRVGEIDGEKIISTLLDTLGEKSRSDTRMARVWRDANTIEVVRAEPYVTAANKVLPLHVLNRARS